MKTLLSSSTTRRFSNALQTLLLGVFVMCLGAFAATSQTLNVVTKTSTVQIKTADIDSATVQTTTLTIIKRDKTTQTFALADIQRMTFTLATGVSGTSNGATLGNILELMKTYPNPTSAQTVIEYELSETAQIEAQITDATGNLVKTLSTQGGTQAVGKHRMEWDATNNAGQSVANGAYTCVIRTARGAMIAQKVIVIR